MEPKNKNRYTPEQFMKSLSERLVKMSIKNNGCLLWTGPVNSKGYGFIRFGKKTLFTHRASWLVNGGILSQKLILHSCDVRNCIEISHLREGSAQDNTDDMMRKKRYKEPKHYHGESSASSKITDEQAKQVIELLLLRKNAVEISKELNISEYIIRDIRRRRTWKHLEFIRPTKIEWKKECLTCNIEFKCRQYEFKKAKFCSHQCYWKSLIK